MKFNFKKYYNRTNLSILCAVVLITGLGSCIIMSTLGHAVAAIIATIYTLTGVPFIIRLLHKEDDRLRAESIIITEELNKVLPLLDNYLDDNNPVTLYVSYKLYSVLHVSEIGSSCIYSWYSDNTQMITDTLIVIDSERCGYSFGIEQLSRYINSIDDLYETKD